MKMSSKTLSPPIVSSSDIYGARLDSPGEFKTDVSGPTIFNLLD
jgi:hypothetical protein